MPAGESARCGQAQDWPALHLLAEPTRRRVFDAVRGAAAPMTRAEVARATGISRRLAAFHLDLLANARLLAVDYVRPPGRGGPGAGRPAKRYAAVGGDLHVSVPARRYDLVARILATGIRDPAGRDAADSARIAAAAEGRRVGGLRRPSRQLSRSLTLSYAEHTLADLGYDPTRTGKVMLLRNCPFEAVVAAAAELVCGINHSFVTGLLDGLRGDPAVSATLRPAPPHCCVRLIVAD